MGARMGPAPHPGRDGDRIQARLRVNQAVRRGDIARPNDLPCKDCGALWVPGAPRHSYDHYKGYAAVHHLTVEPVCARCHHARDNVKKKQTHCVNGHVFDTANTIIRRNGCRACRECRRAHERKRAPRGSDYWRALNQRRRKSHGG